MAETQKAKLMRLLNISEAEAEQVMADDKAIDHGERMPFDLSKEAEKEAKKFANVGTKTVKTPKTERKRPENAEKGSIIAQIAEFLSETDTISAENVEIVNKERQISFKIGENSYSLTLTKHRN